MPRTPSSSAPLPADSPRAKTAKNIQGLLAPTLGEPVRGRLPRGATSLPKAVVELEQKRRIVLGTAKAVSKKGYAEATVADIIAAAGVSRATFYELFRDKEECFLFGFKTLSARHMDAVEQAMQEEGALPDRLLAAIGAYVAVINVDLSMAQAFIAEAEGATPRVREAFDRAQGRLQRSLQEWLEKVRLEFPGVARASETEMSLVMGGLNGHVVSRVRAGRFFTDEQVAAIGRYVFATLGMYEWAKLAKDRV